MRRHAHNPQLGDIISAQRRPTLPGASAARAGPVQDKFPVYNFPWEKVREFLKEKWPSWNRFNEHHVGDNWVFEIPEKLSEGC